MSHLGEPDGKRVEKESGTKISDESQLIENLLDKTNGLINGGAKTIVWNGSMEVFEQTKQNTTAIIGEGDAVTACTQSGFTDQISHVSIGSCASLELLQGKDLSGVTGLTHK
ncbi:unnamed protein product [Rotaria sp. Silwood1]|nr:unnamed protein product [Rotaria sp. Silwood1]